MAKIFISYKRVDKDKVFRIKDKIEAALGEKCWIDLDGIESDAQFANIIIRAINDAEIILFMYSKAHVQINDHSNDWTIRELTFANNRGKRIVFLNIDKAPLTDWFNLMFGTKQQIDATSKVAINRLINDLKRWLIPLSNPISTPTFVDKLRSIMIIHKKWIISFCSAVTVIAIFGLLITSPLSPKESYEKGKEAYYIENYEDAFSYFKEAAKQEYADAQYFLGVCYYAGQGVKQDYIEAVKWFRKAAQQGIAAAQSHLGYCYIRREGVEQNNAEAVKWFRKAAEQGDAEAQYRLGACYEYSWGVKENFNEAVKWYRKAAAQGNTKALKNLGDCYFFGLGVTKNLAEAVKWFRKAAEQGDVDAQKNLGICYVNGYGVEQDYIEAVKWFRKAAEQGDVDAQKGLAQCYYSGKGIEQNNAEAMTWHRQATEQGNTDALTILNSQPQFAPKDNIVIKDTLEHKKGPLLLLGESIERKRREMEIIKEAKAAAPKFGL